ncbi:putative pentatricopeptide repeat-containing protein [Hibiscus syriacus]|uniref:Pentatricopeptide repeat-containing protein n=1 Tax=Hibiscus syriacus TaxID=106335 RepID=A0A6A3BYB5_HIBSY|nr:putative pentatricopeptide repeat-containing protein [Hibiscus syriacus]
MHHVVDEEPAIRTNTTILLGNIASYLNEGTRKRVLINAFTVRALRDTFSPARGAGVMALCATSSYYDMTEIATRILPNIVVLVIDPDRWNKCVWQGLVPPRVEVFLWQLSLNKVAVRGELKKRGVHLGEDSLCPFCNQAEESVQHLFIYCQFSWVLWNRIIAYWGIKLALPTDPSSILISWLRLAKWFLAKYPLSSIQVDSIIGDPSLADNISASLDSNRPVVYWSPPPVDFFKFNVDGAVSRVGLLAGIGGILRDWNRIKLMSFSEKIGPTPIILAELKAIKRGIDIFVSSEWVLKGRLIIESDCKLAVEWLKYQESVPPFLLNFVKDIADAVSEYEVIVRWIPRRCNCEADLLAKEGIGSKAFQAVDQFLQIVKQCNEKSNAGDTADAGSLGISSMPGNAGLLGWAMSSLTLKGKASDQAPVATANSVTPATITTSTSSPGLIETPSTAPVHRVSSSTDFADQPMAPSPTSTDGWGEIENGIHEEHDSDKDGWDDIEPLDEPKPSPVLENIHAAQKRPVLQPVSQPKPQASTSVRPKSTVKVNKDEDDDLWGSIAVPPPKSASKPLNLKTAGTADDDDPWAAIAAPPPITKAKPLSAGRGRGTKAAAPRLGAQRINRTSSTGM